MNDLISRQVALKNIEEHVVSLRDVISELPDDVRDYNGGLLTAIQAVTDTPSAQPEQKKGKWIVTGTFFDFLKCSCCGYKTPWNQDVFNFCPKCGAEMRDEEEEV